MLVLDSTDVVDTVDVARVVLELGGVVVDAAEEEELLPLDEPGKTMSIMPVSTLCLDRELYVFSYHRARTHSS